MTRADPPITTHQLDELVAQINAAYQAAPAYQSELRPWRNGGIARLHSLRKPSRRRYAAHELRLALSATIAELHNALDLVAAAISQPGEVAALRAEVATLQAQLAAQQAARARAPQTTEITIPAKTVQVRSPIQQEIIRLMGSSGQGRAWRLAEQVLAAGLATTERSGDNAIGKLVAGGLLSDYRQRGKAVHWTAGPGGARRLVVLSEAGQHFYRAAWGAEPVESELDLVARAHQSVDHGIGILEARDRLCAAGYVVDDQPAPLLADPAEPHGERSQPDLVLIDQLAQRWPIEVQREVHTRNTPKWAKALALSGRLILILFSEAKRQQQQAILELARTYPGLPPGQILLSSLEALDATTWTWHELRTERRA